MHRLIVFGAGLIEAAEDGGHASAPTRVFGPQLEISLFHLLRKLDEVRDALIRAIAATDVKELGTWQPRLLDGISGLGKHENFDLEFPDDIQLACYEGANKGYELHRDTPGGASILAKRHIAAVCTECFPATGEDTPFPPRMLTMIFYLNPTWSEADKGQLRLYLGPGARAVVFRPKGSKLDLPYVEIPPTLGRLVIFRSTMLHEVLPCEGDLRLAVTQWLSGNRPVNKLR